MVWSQAICLGTNLIGLGLQPGEGIAVWLSSGPETVTAYLASQLSGGCFSPIPLGAEGDVLQQFISGSRSSTALISLNLYDRYSAMERKLKSIRQLIVDTGEALADTTLPSNARSLTSLLFVGLDATLPEIDPKIRSLCYRYGKGAKLLEFFREQGRWTNALAAANRFFNKGQKVLNLVETMKPESLLLGTLWPMIAGAIVFLYDPNNEKLDETIGKENFDYAIIDANSFSVNKDILTRLKIKKIIWDGTREEIESHQAAKVFKSEITPLREAVQSAGFIK